MRIQYAPKAKVRAMVNELEKCFVCEGIAIEYVHTW